MKYIKEDLKRYCLLLNIDYSLFKFYKIFSPRFLPILVYRMASFLKRKNIPIFPQFMTFFNLFLFGLEISPSCQIGGGLFIPHTQGIVIGARSIGINCTIYHGVTLGAKRLDMYYIPENRPLIMDNVTICTGAVVVGGITIHNNVIIKANSVITDDVYSGKV